MVTTLAFNELIQTQTIQGVKITAGDRWIPVIIEKKNNKKNRDRKILKGDQQKLKKNI